MDQVRASLAALEEAPVASYCRHPLVGYTLLFPDYILAWSVVATCQGALHLLPEVVVDCVLLLCRHTLDTLDDTSVDTRPQVHSHTSEHANTWELGKWVLQSHVVPKDDVLAERTEDKSRSHHCSCHTAELDSSSVDAPWTWDAVRCLEYVAEVDVVVDSAVDFDPDFVIVAVVVAAHLVVVLGLVLAVQIAVVVGGLLLVGSVASQSDAERCDVEYMLHAVWHYVQSGCYGRFASFRDRHLEGS